MRAISGGKRVKTLMHGERARRSGTLTAVGVRMTLAGEIGVRSADATASTAKACISRAVRRQSSHISMQDGTSTAMPDGTPPTIRIESADEFAQSVTKQTTGGEVWGAARSLQAYLETHPAELAGCRTLLELGSGTGWLGMMVALNAPAVERIYLSEMLDGASIYPRARSTLGRDLP